VGLAKYRYSILGSIRVSMKRIVFVLILLALIVGGIFLLNPGGSGGSALLDEPVEPGEEEVVPSSVALSGQPGQEGSAKATEADVDPKLIGLAESGRKSFDTGLAGAIQGRVLDLLSEPVARASLYLYRGKDVRRQGAEASIIGQTESDERGLFRMRGLELGGYVLRVEAEGYAVSHRSLQLNAAKPRNVGLSILLRDGYSLQGTVVDLAGKGVAGAWVVAGHARGGNAEAILPEVRSDERGRFAFSSLPPGKAYLLAWAKGHSLGIADGDASQSAQVRIALPQAGPFKIVFSLAEHKEGKAEKPVDVSVQLGLIQGGARMPLPSPLRYLDVPVKGEQGTKGLSAGTYQLYMSSDEVAIEKYWRRQTLTAEKPEAKVELSWKPKLRLRGRLTFKNGKPAPDILLLVQGSYGRQTSSAKSDEKGRFVFSDRFESKGRLYVSVKSPGFLFDMNKSKMTWAKVEPGKKENLLTVARVPLFSGRVIGEDGKPVKGARIWLHPPDKTRDQYGFAASDAKGRFHVSVTRVNETPLVLDAKSDSAFCPQPLPVDGKPRVSREGLVVRLAEGAWVEGQVVDDKRIGVPAVNIRATFIPPPKSQDPKKRRRPWMYRPEARSTTSNREGRFRIRGLSPGSWRISTISKRIKRGTDPVVQLRAREKKGGLRLVLSEGLSIEGRLVTDKGKPVAGAYVRAKFDGKLKKGEVGGSTSAQSGIDGSFVLKGLRAGSFVVTTRLGWQLKRELGLLERGPDGQPPMTLQKQPPVTLLAGTKDYRWVIPMPRFGEIRARLAHRGPLLKHVQVLLRSGKKKWTFDRRLDQGVLSLQRVFSGSYEMTIKSPRFEALTLEVQVHEGQVTDLGLLSLADPPQVEGRVMTVGGQFLSGVWISLDRWMPGIWPTYDMTKGMEQFDGRVMTQSDANGYFRVPIKGRLQVFAFKPGYAPARISYSLPKVKVGAAGQSKPGKGKAGQSKPGKGKPGLILMLQRAGEISVRRPTEVKGQKSRWYVKLTQVQTPSAVGGKKKGRPYSRFVGFQKDKPMRFLGLKPGTYEFEAINFAKSSNFNKKSVLGVSYYEKLEIRPGTFRTIRIP
jgi:Carboxypeptidase regulatory-like domain